MSDLIDRSKLLAALPHVDLDEKDCKVSRAGAVIDMAFIISEQPTVDAVEVVRCKDCIFWGDKDGIQYNEHIEKRCARCRAHNYEFNGQHWGWCPTEDDYCSFGEKKVSE